VELGAVLAQLGVVPAGLQPALVELAVVGLARRRVVLAELAVVLAARAGTAVRSAIRAGAGP